jgi:hypothetical protein
VQTWILIAAAMAGQATESHSPAASQPREVAAIRREVSDLLAAESSTTSGQKRGTAVRRMSEVYLEIVRDDRFATNFVLQQQKTKLWSRLIRVRDELKRRQTAQRRTAPDVNDGEREVAGALAAHLQLASQTMGGPAAVFEGASGGGAVTDDFSDELIELIQNTIDPDHWNVNGGPGAIAYYRPALALVVRARSEVHGRIGDVLGGIRAAGR